MTASKSMSAIATAAIIVCLFHSQISAADQSLIGTEHARTRSLLQSSANCPGNTSVADAAGNAIINAVNQYFGQSVGPALSDLQISQNGSRYIAQAIAPNLGSQGDTLASCLGQAVQTGFLSAPRVAQNPGAVARAQEIRFDIRVETAILIATNLTSDATNVITAGLTPVELLLKFSSQASAEKGILSRAFLQAFRRMLTFF